MLAARAIGAAILIGVAAFLPTTASAKSGRVVVVATIDAKSAWRKVSLRLHGRGVLRFQTEGQWVFNPALPAVDGDGAQNLPTAGRSSYTFSGPQGREGQLIGRIGRLRPFVAGAHGVHQVGRREIGPLYLMINDDFNHALGAGLLDNSGHLTVRVEFERSVRQRHRSAHHRAV
jgi:hypothetical protein